MKIENYTVSGFKGIKYYSKSNPQKRTIFLGKNGAGKTSMLEAIRFGLTGDAPDNPIRAGFDSANVVVELEGLAPISRTLNADKKPNQIRYNGSLTTQKSVSQTVFDITGIDPNTLKVITSGDVIRAMSAGELSKFLTESGFLPLSVDRDEIVKWCELSPDAAEEITPFLPMMPEKFGLQEITECYNTFYERKSILTRDIKEAKIKADFKGKVPERTLGEIDKAIAALNSGSSALAAYEAAKKLYDDAKLKRDKQLHDIGELEAKLSKIACSAPDEAKKKNAEAQIRTLSMRIASATGTMSVLEKNLSTMESLLKDLSSSKCPLSCNLVCTTDKTEIKDEIESNISSTKAEIEKTKKSIDDMSAKTNMFKSQIDQYEKDLSAYQAYAASNERLKALRSAIISLPTLPAKPVVKPVDPSAIEALNKERSAVVEYMLAKDAEAKAEMLEATLKVVAEIVAALNPKGGIRDKVIAYALGPLVDYCNKRADEMGLNITIDIQAASGSRIFCKTPGSGEYIPLESASSGQKAIVMFLVLDMLNSLSGLGIMFLDGLELLDEEAMEALLTIIESADAEKTYDHIFMSAVNHDDTVDVVARHASNLDVVNM